MAYEIVKRLEAQNNITVLHKLAAAVTESDRKRGKLHQVFEPSFDAKQCRRDAFINQKLNYMHNNPCTGTWNLAASPTDYPHSSALYYETGKQSVYEVVNYKELDDINLPQ